MLSVTQRAHAYNTSFAQYPASHFMVTDDRWASAQWVMGNNYKAGATDAAGKPFYGAYPPGYLKRVSALFPDATRVLHLFAGSLPASDDYTRFGNTLIPKGDDRTFKSLNDREGDAAKLAEFYPPNSFDLILADPPYSKDDAARYGVEMVDRRKVLRQCYEVLGPGGNLVWLDTVLPMYRKDMYQLWGLVGITRSTNHRYRQVAIFTRLGDGARLTDQKFEEFKERLDNVEPGSYLPEENIEPGSTLPEEFVDESIEDAA